MSAIEKHLSASAHWFRQARTRLTLIWSGASLLLAGGWALASRPEVPLVMQLWIVAVGVGLFGVLHGGLDHIVGERVFKRAFKRGWLIYFAIGYVGLAIAVMIGWWLIAPIMLLLFLAASIVHFGLRDGARGRQKRNIWIQFATVILLGAAPIIIPWIAFPQEVSVLFGWLTVAYMFVSAAAVGSRQPIAWIVGVIALYMLLIYVFMIANYPNAAEKVASVFSGEYGARAAMLGRIEAVDEVRRQNYSSLARWLGSAAIWGAMGAALLAWVSIRRPTSS